ncbi:MAG: CoA transferase [Deltaproteobacteria bacterium]|nr:CoA transferase [Deltaproteobacteria bacterium]MBW2413614.1 CoA transferase [Deltaproteobacteria bacterium]
MAEAPLAGVRVLDLTRYLAGPFCTMLLADYGADVVKAESRKGREFRPPGSTRDNYFFLSANRGKRSMTLDLRSEGGRELLLRLLPRFDVLVENFRPAVMEDLGLGPESLCERFPRLVYCGISGFGRSGPYRDRPGFDQIAQGMSGFMSLTGTEESGPTRAGLAIGDVLGGIFAAHGVQLALLARERSGRGQVVDTSLLEAMMGILTWGAGMYFESGVAPGPAGQHHPLSSPYGRFKARDGYMNITAGAEKMWRGLAEVLEHPEWTSDERFESAVGRVRNRAALTQVMEQALAKRDVATWVKRLNAAGVPSGPVFDLEQVFSDPQVLAREMLVELPHPEMGTFKTTGLPIKLSETPGRIERRPPLHGEHTDEVLQECGLDADEIARLRASEVI